MKSDVETLNPTRVRLTVEVPFDELRPSLDAAYKRIAGQIVLPGFRRGKAPTDHRPAFRARRRAGRGDQRGAAAVLLPRRPGQLSRPSASPRST